MVRHKNFSVVKKALLLGEPVILAGCALVWIFADSLCVFAFGEAFAGTAPVLRAFIPGIACLLPSYVLGFPTLGAMKQTRYANRSVFFGTAVHVTGLVCLAVSGRITAVSLAALTSLSEFAIMAFRIGAVARCRRKML
jgi:PST family polysaccharide transporter